MLYVPDSLSLLRMGQDTLRPYSRFTCEKNGGSREAEGEREGGKGGGREKVGVGGEKKGRSKCIQFNKFVCVPVLFHESVALSRCHSDPSLPAFFATIPLAHEMNLPLKRERGKKRKRGRRRDEEGGERKEEEGRGRKEEGGGGRRNKRGGRKEEGGRRR